MPIFGNDTFRLLRENDRLRNERDDLAARLSAQDVTVHNLRQALEAAKEPTPAPEMRDVANQLKGFVPSAPASPGFAMLQKAHDARSAAQAIHVLLLSATNGVRR